MCTGALAVTVYASQRAVPNFLVAVGCEGNCSCTVASSLTISVQVGCAHCFLTGGPLAGHQFNELGSVWGEVKAFQLVSIQLVHIHLLLLVLIQLLLNSGGTEIPIYSRPETAAYL